MGLAERYLAIEQLRMGDRLQVQWRRSEPLPWDLPMPRLVLQPLLENAVVHGISRLAYSFRPRARMTGGWADSYYVCELDLPLDGAGGTGEGRESSDRRRRAAGA